MAVAARSLESAEKLASRFSIPRAYEGYDKLAEDPDVEIVYIGTVHSTHRDIAMYASEKGGNYFFFKKRHFDAAFLDR